MEDSSEFELTRDELETAQKVIDVAMPGVYTLKKLYGKGWDKEFSPTTFGTRFKKSVEEGQLSSIALHDKKTGANAVQYTVKGE